MREIKFRAWDKEGNRMSFDVGINPKRSHSSITYSSDGLFLLPNDESMEKKFILMQYTGLKDKNGVEIYEGDIIGCGTHRAEVRWEGIRLDPFDYISGLDYAHGCRSIWTEKDMEVIGNIYENPELVKGGE